MILILIAILALIVIPTFVMNRSRPFNLLRDVIHIFSAFIGVILLLGYIVVAFEYFAADYKKDIINREYGTNYTQLEVFYASDVIDTVRELDRKRIEVNGDLITGEEK